MRQFICVCQVFNLHPNLVMSSCIIYLNTYMLLLTVDVNCIPYGFVPLPGQSINIQYKTINCCFAAMVAGKEYFDARHGLCDFVSAICIVLCVNALLSIGAISFNRYVHICHTAYYERIFSKRNNAIMIAAFWTLGVAITTPLFFGWGAHVFDGKSLECVWDRTSHLSYTLFFVICIVLTPVIIISFSFIGIYRHVTNSKKRLAAFNEKNGAKKDGGKEEKSSRKLARTLFAIFMLFVACWMPYSVLMVVDFGDTAPHEIYLFAVQLAHLHSSLNFVMYAITNGQMRKAYRQTLLTIFPCCRCLRNNRVGADDTTRGRTMGGESTIVSDAK